MTTESKKLQTLPDGGIPNNQITGERWRDISRVQIAAAHDARIAHEQREVIKPLAEAFADILDYVEGYAGSADADDPVHELLPRYRAALAAAAPFLGDINHGH